MEEDYYQLISQYLNKGYNPYLPQYGQTQPAELYELEPPQQQQGGGLNLNQAMNIYDMFAGGGGAGGVTGGGLNYGVASSPAAGGGTWYGPFAEGGFASGGGAAGGASGASSAGGGMGSALASAGPWAALAALIIGNEREAREHGFRSEDDTQYAKDLLGGKVFEQDVSQRWAPKLESAWGGSGSMAKAAADFGTLDFSNAFSNLNQSMKDDPIIGALRGLF